MVVAARRHPDEPVVLATTDFPAQLVAGWDLSRITVRGLQELMPGAMVRLNGTDNDGGAVLVSIGAFTDYMLRQAEAGDQVADDEPLAVFDSCILDQVITVPPSFEQAPIQPKGVECGISRAGWTDNTSVDGGGHRRRPGRPSARSTNRRTYLRSTSALACWSACLSSSVRRPTTCCSGLRAPERSLTRIPRGCAPGIW
eukprot:COSAG01_NODE_1561_length_9917_cov_5.742514_4_plen_199_part_00